MKRVLLALTLLIFFTNTSRGQDIKLPIDTDTHKVSYSFIGIVKNAKHKDLYSKAKQWVVLSFKSAKDVIQMDDPENGKLILKGYTGGFQSTFRNVAFTENIYYVITISTKDGKYKIKISDFEKELISEGTVLSKVPVERTIEHIETEKDEATKVEITKIYFDLKKNINSIGESTIQTFNKEMNKKDDF